MIYLLQPKRKLLTILDTYPNYNTVEPPFKRPPKLSSLGDRLRPYELRPYWVKIRDQEVEPLAETYL